MNSFTRTLIVVIIILAAVGIGAYWSLTHHKGADAITSFEECAAAGNPVQESYPRRCSADGTTFTENVTITPPSGNQPPVATSSTNIRVSSPVPYQDVGLPIVIQGEARTFEQSFAWRIRDEDRSILVEGHGMTNAPDVGQFGPFTVTASYPQPKGTHGTVEVFEYSAKDGSEVWTVAIPVNFKSVESMNVNVFFSDRAKDPDGMQCETTYAFTRRVPKTTAVARTALIELLRGPMGTEANATTHINSGTKLNSIRIENGTAYADFDHMLGVNVGGSCRVQAIRSQIENTLLQFPTVQNVIISIDGDSELILQP